MKQYPIVILPLGEEDGGGFLGFVPDLPGCMSDGESEAEAIENTKLAIAEWIDTQIDRGVDIPQPGSASAKAIEREDKLLDAIKSLVEYNEDADSRIKELERKLTELIAILRDDSGRSRLSASVPAKLSPSKNIRTH